MDNKFDAYEGFDPTKDKTSNIDCGEVYWDMELEKQLADQPTVCDVLKAHLEPVHRLNDETIYYAVKDADCDFIKGDVTSLGEETVHPLAEG